MSLWRWQFIFAKSCLRWCLVVFDAMPLAAEISAIVRPVPKAPLVLGAGRLWDEAKNLQALRLAAPAVPWPVVVAGPTVDPAGRDAAGAAASLGPVGPRDPAAAPDGRGDAHRGHVPDPAAAPAGRPGEHRGDPPDPPVSRSGQPARLLGPLAFDELAPWLWRAAVFAAPARYEPFGLAALEAAQAGCALVLGDLPSLREVWGDAALYVDPDDPGALAGALCRLAADDGRRGWLQQAAAQRAGRYSATAMADAMLGVYGAVSGGGFRTMSAAGAGR